MAFRNKLALFHSCSNIIANYSMLPHLVSQFPVRTDTMLGENSFILSIVMVWPVQTDPF